ncbi:MAG TPA: amidohydrolase [Steroidobacteraceae bacterium]|nr:amidohydrolase [Steroidobacteraceae bacterium]
MTPTRFLLLIFVASLSGWHAGAATVDAAVDKELPSLVDFYKRLHAAPEVSHFEVATSAALAAQLRDAGFTVTEGVGKYETPGLIGHGVVAVLENGKGPTLLIRTDLDALPVEEKTGLAYASKVRFKLPNGQEVPVMHACGHDIHMATLVGTARLLASLRSSWRGKLILIGQPSEEVIDGAKAMLADGLYERFGRPDFVLALHDWDDFPAGKVGITSGYMLAQSTQMDILVRGVGAHGSKPEKSKDPIVLAAGIVLALQTIVSREISPFEQAVVTVGTIHGGTKRNIIPDEVKLELNIRTYKEDVRQKILASVERIARGEAIAAGVPEDRMPLVTVSATEFAPALYNDPKLTERIVPAMKRAVGADSVLERSPAMGSEDFGELGLDGKIPVVMFRVGAVDPAKYEEAQRTGANLPTLHSPLFAPLPAPTIEAGVKAMTAAALDLLKK